MLDRVKEIAKSLLLIPIEGDSSDIFLFERSERLADNCVFIAQLPEVAAKSSSAELLPLGCAAYLNEAGLASHLRSNKNSRQSFWADQTDQLVYLSTEIVNEHLTGLIPDKTLNKINAIIIASYKNHTDMIEARILSDARNLDDMGIVGLFNDLKNYFDTGKGINNLLKSWERKVDYSYWQSRLNGNFHFGSVKEIAQKRLYAAQYFMKQLKGEINAADIEKFIKCINKKNKKAEQSPVSETAPI